MTHKRIVRSAVQIHPITELHPSVDSSALIKAAIQQCLGPESVELAYLWDIAALLLKSHKEEATEDGAGEDVAEASAEAATEDVAEAGEGTQTEQQSDEAEQRATSSAVCRSAFTQACFFHLPFLISTYLSPSHSACKNLPKYMPIVIERIGPTKRLSYPTPIGLSQLYFCRILIRA